jgi:hypothetical protein
VAYAGPGNVVLAVIPRHREEAIRMQQSPFMPSFLSKTHASYEVRVRGTIFLWGSAGMTMNAGFDKPLLLHVRNNVFGEPVKIGTQVAGGPQTTLGTLQPGECLTIQIQNISGVFATCALESNIDCVVHPSN